MTKMIIVLVTILIMVNFSLAQDRSPDQVKRKTISDAATLRVLKKLNKRIKRLEKEKKKSSKSALDKYRFYGRVYVDTAGYTSDRTKLKNGSRITSARMGVTGQVVGDFSFHIQLDVKNNSSSVNQAYIKYKNPNYTVIVGHHGRATGLENWMSSKHTLFASGAYVNNAFDQGGRIGASISTGNEMFTLLGGIFAGSLGTTSDKGDPLSFAGRATLVPYKAPNFLWHIGAHSVYERKKDNVAFNSGVETNVERTVMVGVKEFSPTNNFRTTGVESGVTFHSLYLSGEYYMATLEKRNESNSTVTDYNFTGYYFSGGYFLTGESRSYGGGAFGSFKVNSPLSKGGFGAFELAARYSAIDLNDTDHNTQLSHGGEATSSSFGINWSPENNVRLLVSHTIADVNHSAQTGDSSLDETVSITQARFQIGF